MFATANGRRMLATKEIPPWMMNVMHKTWQVQTKTKLATPAMHRAKALGIHRKEPAPIVHNPLPDALESFCTLFPGHTLVRRSCSDPILALRRQTVHDVLEMAPLAIFKANRKFTLELLLD